MWASLPAFNHLAERELAFSMAANPALYSGFCIMALLTGLVAGLYPAFYLSSFRPVEVLKGKLVNNSGGEKHGPRVGKEYSQRIAKNHINTKLQQNALALFFSAKIIIEVVRKAM